METWFLIIGTICFAALLKAFMTLGTPKSPLPPGPRANFLISRVIWLRKSFKEKEASIKTLHAKYGPIVSLPIAPWPLIFISSHDLAHQALVKQGAAFAERHTPLPLYKILITSNQHTLFTAHYGSKWRSLRRNLTSNTLHPSKVKSYSHARKWVLDILVNQLSNSGLNVNVIEHIRFAMFGLLALMCFGDKLNENQIREIQTAQQQLLVSLDRFRVYDWIPWLPNFVFRSRWNELFNLIRKQKEILVPLIHARKQQLEQDEAVTSYVDTLLSLELQDDETSSSNAKRKLSEEQIISACSEFLDGGTDTTSTSLQWIMANLIKYPEIQEHLYQEIRRVIGQTADQVEENDLSNLPYLKAVVLEGLRRHPPSLILPRVVIKDTELGGYMIPKKALVIFLSRDMSLNPEVWDDPLAFKPERFMSTTTGDDNASNVEFDITGIHEIKMMPFGAGRRICPALGLAMHHLEYFVANLVWKFKWEAADGYEVDLSSEKVEFTLVMKNPLQARITPRNAAY